VKVDDLSSVRVDQASAENVSATGCDSLIMKLLWLSKKCITKNMFRLSNSNVITKTQ
jgi:hypothetical protein